MPVYIDDMRAKFGNMIMCHLMADTTAELLAIADKIRVPRHWIQYPGTYREHFDICESKRKLAVEAGAIEVTWRQMGDYDSMRKNILTSEQLREQKARMIDWNTCKRSRKKVMDMATAALEENFQYPALELPCL